MLQPKFPIPTTISCAYNRTRLYTRPIGVQSKVQTILLCSNLLHHPTSLVSVRCVYLLSHWSVSNMDRTSKSPSPGRDPRLCTRSCCPQSRSWEGQYLVDLIFYYWIYEQPRLRNNNNYTIVVKIFTSTP